ncbi:hypothetical protein BGZ96_008098 [Linnemannia gamsii]|uniref:Sm protein B n=1 Tax=Linnemannia gamsii TaxID=64522 RepID=A0ABQ7K141_9FUNG|nr:hypothetical protein BGZ96_008098 [Linnemannia gamsii]
MGELLQFRLRVVLLGTRVMAGQILAFDKQMNLALADCEEFTVIKPKLGASVTAAQELEQKRTLGLVILRGDILLFLHDQEWQRPLGVVHLWFQEHLLD